MPVSGSVSDFQISLDLDPDLYHDRVSIYHHVAYTGVKRLKNLVIENYLEIGEPFLLLDFQEFQEFKMAM